MSNVKKLMMTAAGGEALNVEEVFSTYLYTGNSSNRSITNNVDLSTEGGMVWIKGRTSTTYDFNNTLFDTERGAGYRIHTDLTSAQGYNSNSLTSFNTDGFSLGTDGSLLVNWSSNDYVSWTFRKAPKFFDVVTYTGNSVAGRTISHNLGSVPGMVIIKNLDVAVPWAVYHRGMHPTPEDYYMNLNTNYARADNSSYWNDTAPTSTTITLGTANRVNALNSTYVAYIFAHNDGDGEFGPNGDQDIIKCGSYTGNGSSDGPEIDLGFEPQWFLTKRASSDADWHLVDNMREMSSSMRRVYPNNAYAEDYESDGMIPTATGIKFTGVQSQINASGQTYIYMAIRRGPMAVPESATDVFAIDTQTASSGDTASFTSNFVVDMAIRKATTGISGKVVDRLRGPRVLYADLTNAESGSGDDKFDYMEGYFDSNSVNASNFSWMWKRAPNFFDVVAYTGNGTAGRTVSHNLGVAPEMMWVKARDRTGQWIFYHSGIGNTGAMWINDIGDGVITDSTYWNNTSPSGTNFSLGNNYRVNQSGYNYIAYLFGSVDGVSKVGSYTGDGTDGRTIDCGFSSGARLVLIKDTAANLPFMLYDSERGIVAGNDSLLQLNSNAAEITNFDLLDPDSSGFKVNSTINYVNQSGKTYLFYAIA